MDSFSLILEVNFLALVIGSVVGFALGALWYNPILFGRYWQLAQPNRGPEDYNMKATDMVLQFICMLILNLFFAWIASIISYGFTPMFSEWAAAWIFMSIVVGLGQFSNWIFSGHRLARVLIDISYASTAMLFFALIALLFQAF